MPNITEYVQLGGQVVVVVLFLNYLAKRDSVWSKSLEANSKSNILLAKALQKLTDVVYQNTSAVKENIPTVTKNTVAVKENIPTVIKNTVAVKENTDVVKGVNGNIAK